MIIGVPKEIKNNENRVAITPSGVKNLVSYGHHLIVQKDAGTGSGFVDIRYLDAGAEIVDTISEVYHRADLIFKVKEPTESEYQYLRNGQILFAFLHLASNHNLLRVLLEKNVTAIAFETVQLNNGKLPLLAPMSEIAGRMSIQVGANLLQKENGGAGVLLGGVPGVPPGEVTIIGGGIVGTHAAKIAVGMGAHVTVVDVKHDRLSYLDDIFGNRISTMIYNGDYIADLLTKTDLLIGAVLVTGAVAPKTVSQDMVKAMKNGSVIVDVAIDQGGSIETIDRITTHDNPSYTKHGVIHYSVANMPGAVPRTSTDALAGVTFPYLIELANHGVHALLEDKTLIKGLNTYYGKIAYKAVADSIQGYYVAAEDLLT